MVITGLSFGNVTLARTASPKERHDIDVFWTMIDNLLNAVLFVMIGLQLLIIPFQIGAVYAGLIAIVLSLAGRYISIFVTTAVFKVERCFSTTHRNIVHLLTWGGLRGGLSIALAFSLPEGPEKTLIVNMTFAVVAFSILVQGLTIGRLYNKMQMEAISPEV
jgi:CPA1 family monovalent cation:H+ antiporter